MNDEIQALELARQLLCIPSETNNKRGVDAVGELLRQKFTELGFTSARYSHPTYGDLVYLRTRTVANKPRVLLSGHLDTVFEPSGHLDNLTEDEIYVYSPGANDMKGGLAMIYVALQKYIQAGNPLTNIGILLSPDEEIGSVTHRAQMKKIAKQYDYALVLEGVGNNWELCNQRKGVAELRVVARGKAGHAGHWANRRGNAIDNLAQFTTEFVAMHDRLKGTTINSGFVTGGSKINVVPDTAEGRFDIRFATSEEIRRLQAAVTTLARKCHATAYLTVHFAPMEISGATQQCMKAIRRAGHRIDRRVRFEKRGSASDGNLFASCGLGVVDGFGTKGYDHHTKKERLIKGSLTRQAQLLTAVLEELLL